MPSSVADTSHQVFIFCSTILWGLYTSLGVQTAVQVLLPEHTRDAAFQLFCDLRSNTPKDWAFAKRHATALKPRTFIGWLAASTVLLCTSAYVAAATALALAVSVAALNLLLVLSVLGGVTLAVLLGAFSASLFVGACIAGSAAFTCGLAYTGAASTKLVVTSTSRLLLGPPREAQLPASSLGGGTLGALEPVPEEEFYDVQEQEREQLNAEAAAAADAAVAKARATLASLQNGGSAAAEYAAQKLGLGSPAAADAASSSSGAVSPPTPPATAEATSPNSVFTTPTKKRRAAPVGSSEDGSGSAAPSPQRRAVGGGNSDAGADNAASDSTQAADLQAFMEAGFMGSPPGGRSPISRPATPERPRPIAAAS